METKIWGNIDNSQKKRDSNDNHGYSLTPVAAHVAGVAASANVVLLDNSGSTRDVTSVADSTPKLFREKEVATMFISKLPSRAQFSLISFDEPAVVEIPLQSLDEKLTAIQKVQQLDYEGGTGMRDALTLAMKEFNKASENYFKRLYLISDGMVTDGDCTEIADTLKAAGVQIHCIGFGQRGEIDEEAMREIASVSENGYTLYMHFTEFSQLSRYMGTQTQTITH